MTQYEGLTATICPEYTFWCREFSSFVSRWMKTTTLEDTGCRLISPEMNYSAKPGKMFRFVAWDKQNKRQQYTYNANKNILVL